MMKKLQRLSVYTLFVLAWLSMSLRAQAQATNAQKEAAKTAKVSSDLYTVLTNGGIIKQSTPEGAERLNLFRTSGNSIAIDAVANSEDEGQALLQALRSLGLSKGIVSKQRVSGYLPIDKLGELKSIGVLKFARPSYKPIKNVGSVTSQGDVALRANVARTTYSVSGAGVKVGVLSDSYNNLGGAANGVTSGDLPAGVEVLADLGDADPADRTGSDEGRAMIELIHDVAPGSPQAFHTAFEGDLDFAQGIRDLAAAGCKIITDDVFYFAEPFFQDGPIAQAVDEVVGNGIPYFSAAGNSARKSYQSVYSATTPPAAPGGLTGAHNFSGGDKLQSLTLAAGQQVIISFQWDNPFRSVSGAPGAQTDMDLLVYIGGTFRRDLSSEDFNVGADPVEIIGIGNSGSAPLVIELVLAKYEGPDPTLVKWINFGSTVLVEYDTKSPTVVGHNNSARGIGTGASAWFNTPAFSGGLTTALINNFSSAGGTPILFNTAGVRLGTPIVRQKPDITAVDGGNTTFFTSDIPQDADAFPNFFGTSAAAPHAAAVAALMMEKVPTITPATILSTLKSTALDMDDPATAGFDTGFDFGTGFGFIQADRALQAISNTAPTVANAIAPQSATVGQAFTFTIPANTFADADPLTLTVSGLPMGLSFNGSTSAITGTPSMSGVSSVTVTATDPGSLSASTSFALTVNPAPVVVTSLTLVASASPTTILTTGTTTLSATVSGGTTPYSYTFTGPGTINQSGNTASVSGLPVGVQTFTVLVADATSPTSQTASTTVSVTVSAANAAPTVANAIAPQSATVGQAFTFTIPANTFADADPLTLTVSGLPMGLTFNGSTSAITGTPSMSGVSSVTVTATDPGSLSASTSFALTVSPASVIVTPGVFAITGVTTVNCVTITTGKRTLIFTPQYAGTTGQPISFSVANELPATSSPGPYALDLYTDNPVITLKAVQTGSAGEASFVYNWLAACQGSAPGNTAPTVANAIPPQSATVGQAYSYVIPANTFTDAQTPNGLTLSASSLPAGLSLSGSTISGTPSTTVGSPFSVTITATDPGGLSASTSFVFTISPASGTPTPGSFAITGVTVVNCVTVSAAKRTLIFTPQYAGTTGQPISFSVANELPATSSPGPYALDLYTDNPVITLKAVQAGSAGEASFVYNWLANCNSGTNARVGVSTEQQAKLDIRVLGNPIQNDQMSVEVRGAGEQSLQLYLTDAQGKILETRRVEKAASLETHTFEVSQRPVGLLLLRATTPTQVQTVKVIKSK